MAELIRLSEKGGTVYMGLGDVYRPRDVTGSLIWVDFDQLILLLFNLFLSCCIFLSLRLEY